MEKFNETESLNELSKEAMENLEKVEPVEMPENKVSDAKENHTSDIPFTGGTVTVCVCGLYSGVTCPMG